MFELSTDRARQVIFRAQEEARRLNRDYIGPEHILLGLIRDTDGAAAQALGRLGADLGRVRQQVIELLAGAQGEERPGPGQRVPRSGAEGPRPGGLLSQIAAGVDAVDAQLSGLWPRIGIGPDLRDLDQKIAQARRGKEEAARAEDYEQAAALRDAERQLRAERDSRQQDWTAAHPGLSPVTDGLFRLSEEARLLRGRLRPDTTDPRDGAA